MVGSTATRQHTVRHLSVVSTGILNGVPKVTQGSGYLPIELWDENHEEWLGYDVNDADKLDDPVER